MSAEHVESRPNADIKTCDARRFPVRPAQHNMTMQLASKVI